MKTYKRRRFGKCNASLPVTSLAGNKDCVNIDHLFDLPNGHLYAVKDCFCEKTWSHTPQYKIGYCQQCPDPVHWPREMGPPPPLYLNAGMFVYEPSLPVYDDLLSRLKTTPPTPFAEQDFLNMFFRDVYKPIPNVYNLVLAMLWRHPENVELEKVKVVHYCTVCAAGSKPWRYTGEENMDWEPSDGASGLEQPVSKNVLPDSELCPEYQLISNCDNVDYGLPVGYHFDMDRIEVGSVYEIDHNHLPVRTPAHLRSIRVAMVSDKTKLNVAVRYPSSGSLETFFTNCIGEMYPALDEKFVMGTALATKVLVRQVPSQQFAEKKHLKEFWLASTDAPRTDEVNCLAELLKGGGMVCWGTRRKVKFLKKQKEDSVNENDQSASSLSTKKTQSIEGENLDETEDDFGDEEIDGDDDEQVDDEGEDDKDAVDILDEDMGEDGGDLDVNLKRKRYMLRKSTRQNTEKTKVVKSRKRQHQIKKQKTTKRCHKGNRCRELVVADNPKDRWSAERYQAATENLLAVMKARKATAGNPILRPNLREEARKRIGDTGLLDHLLKHMAGELAPDGKVRFRRRHNADGAMEYWLESADLVNVRLEAGVADPYWVPPPGWEPGDCPTQDPIFAKELKLLKQEVSQLKRNVKDMVPRKQMELELRKLRREMNGIVSSKQQDQNLAFEVSPKPSDIGQKLNQLASLLDSSKSDVAKAPSSMEKYNEQLLVIQDVLTGIQAEIKNSLPKHLSELALVVTREPNGKEKMPTVELNCATPKQDSVAERALAEEEAATLERQKSGFRIFKPQGTFQWPNVTCNNSSDTLITTTSTNVASSQVVVQFEDLFAVSTPPVSSSIATVPPHLPYHPNSARPSSPVKPLAERRAVTVTVSTVSNEKGSDQINHSTTSPAKYSPKIPSSSITRPGANHTSSAMPQTGSGYWEVMPGVTGTEQVQRKLRKYPSVSTPCISERNLGTWLALGTANSALRTPARKSEYKDVLNLSTE